MLALALGRTGLPGRPAVIVTLAFDVPGMVLIAVAGAAILVLGNAPAPATDPLWAPVLAAVAVLTGAAFVGVQRYSPHLLIPLAVLAHRTVARALLATFCSGVALFGTMAFLPSVIPARASAYLVAMTAGKLRFDLVRAPELSRLPVLSRHLHDTIDREVDMPRITGVPTREAGPVLRVLYWFSRKRFGAVMEPVTVAAHHKKILKANLRHEVAVGRAAKVLPVSVRELAQYRVAQQVQCTWCIDFGTMLQRHEGLDIDRLRKIDDYATAPEYTHQERLALAYADAMTATPGVVTDEQVAELVAEFGKAGVIELSYLIALENARGRFNSALGITDQGFTSGEACKIPVPADAELDRPVTRGRA